MNINQKLLDNANFWYDGYVRHVNAAEHVRKTGDAGRAEMHMRIAREFFDLHCRVCESAMEGMQPIALPRKVSDDEAA
jgi:hypothetical protein